MGYHIKIGNTQVTVEDLGRTYPGTCQHCGKTHIRYLAHVYQDLASTVLKEKHGEINRSKDEICDIGIAIICGKRSKTIDVGCVCVRKYLVDCGVDAGLAERIQKQVTTITGYLQKCAALEGAKAPEKLAEAIQNAEIVVRFGDRRIRVRDGYLRSTHSLDRFEANISGLSREEYYKVNSIVAKDYDEAVDRWKRENHGYYLGRKAPEAADLVKYFDRKLAEYTRKLSWFTDTGRKANYV